ncbi:MAG: SpoIIIAH-like family protein [Oscillospiraceae bacterium]|nr:SpoIIIAH-like family protein [Oscillospiraceae bacterium]
MKKWKKNIVAAAVLLTVCGGIYANWAYGQDQSVADLTNTLDENKIMSADKLVMADDSTNNDDGINTMSDYFAAVRLSRQEARDSAVSLLQEAMAYGDVEASQSGTQLQELVNMALNEAQIESLVIAKGYADCVAYISDEAISVAVAAPEGGLQQQDVAVVTDIILNQSKFTTEQIYVVEVK